MANLKRNMIELVKEVKEGEIVTEKYWTPVFMPLSVVYKALDLNEEIYESDELKENEKIEKMVDFVANDIYKEQFTKDELVNGLHAPDAVKILREQVLFVTRGHQSDETKKFLEKKD